MNRRLSSRLERLEQQVGGSPDLAGETARYGQQLWSVAGARAYAQDTPDGARLSVVGPSGTVTYAVPGMQLGDLR
ncbi:hypothetical protein [Streptomyces fagopyri]